jgi:hypothetical protein
VIALREDCFLVSRDDGGTIPCSIEELTLEVAGGAADSVDREWLRQAAAGVIHYYKNELGREHITVAEFAAALSKVLQGFGLTAEVTTAEPSTQVTHVITRKVLVADLREIACDAGKLGELEFFRLLQERFAAALAESPDTLEFCGLRSCVKQIKGRLRWCSTCSDFEAEIVNRLRGWYGQQASEGKSALVVH